jgi:hypothetical protein
MSNSAVRGGALALGDSSFGSVDAYEQSSDQPDLTNVTLWESSFVYNFVTEFANHIDVSAQSTLTLHTCIVSDSNYDVTRHARSAGAIMLRESSMVPCL